MVSADGSSYVYPTETPSLSANTWTKVTKTIPGNSNLTFNNDNGEGLRIIIVAYCGSSYSTDSATINTWNAYSSSNQFGRASTSTWYETNDATLEITGLQLEVGSQATAFEHRSQGEELHLCQRYYQTGFAKLYNANQPIMVMSQNFMPEMRAAPTITGEQFGSETNAIWSSIEVTTPRACAFYKNGEICQRWKCDAEL